MPYTYTAVEAEVDRTELLEGLKRELPSGSFVVFLGDGSVVIPCPAAGQCVSCEAGKIDLDFFAGHSWSLAPEAREDLLEVAFQVVDGALLLGKKQVMEQQGECLLGSEDLQFILHAFRFGACVRLHCTDWEGVDIVERSLTDLAYLVSVEQVRAHASALEHPELIDGLTVHRSKLDSLAAETNSLIIAINSRRPRRSPTLQRSGPPTQ